MIPKMIEVALKLTKNKKRFEKLVWKYAEELQDSDLTRHPAITAYFIHLREAGQSERFAAMAACQSAPKAMTDREYLEGIGTLDKQFEGDAHGLRQIIAGAKACGYNPSMYDFYSANAARFPGDPMAFMKGRGDLGSAAANLGVPVEGAVNQAASRPAMEPERIKLAEDIVQRKMKQYARQDPKLAKKPKELREMVIDKHGAP